MLQKNNTLRCLRNYYLSQLFQDLNLIHQNLISQISIDFFRNLRQGGCAQCGRSATPLLTSYQVALFTTHLRERQPRRHCATSISKRKVLRFFMPRVIKIMRSLVSIPIDHLLVAFYFPGRCLQISCWARRSTR